MGRPLVFTHLSIIVKNTIQYNTTSFISNIEHNNITPTICSQHWDGWKGGGQKNIIIVVHPQSGAVDFLFKKELRNFYCSVENIIILKVDY